MDRNAFPQNGGHDGVGGRLNFLLCQAREQGFVACCKGLSRRVDCLLNRRFVEIRHEACGRWVSDTVILDIVDAEAERSQLSSPSWVYWSRTVHQSILCVR